MSSLILPIAASASAGLLWMICHITDAVHEPYWLAAAVLVAGWSAHGLRRRWGRQLQAAYHEGYADGYIRGVSDRLTGDLPRPEEEDPHQPV